MKANNKGGRRKGAGRPKGATKAHNLVTLQSPATNNLLPEFVSDLTHDQKLAARLLAQGLTQAQVAEALEVHENTIYNWNQLEPFRETVSIYKRMPDASPFSALEPSATMALIKALKQGNTTVAIKVYEWLYGKPIVTEQQQIQEDIRILYEDVTPKS